MRNMSFALTSNQILNHEKRVTRRFGWWTLKPGDLLQPVLKGQGLKKGERVHKLGCPIRILSTRPESLNEITREECELEGFPWLTPAQFITMMRTHHKCQPAARVNRIAFDYVPDEPIDIPALPPAVVNMSVFLKAIHALKSATARTCCICGATPATLAYFVLADGTGLCSEACRLTHEQTRQRAKRSKVEQTVRRASMCAMRKTRRTESRLLSKVHAQRPASA
jgi:hypothetical protein